MKVTRATLIKVSCDRLTAGPWKRAGELRSEPFGARQVPSRRLNSVGIASGPAFNARAGVREAGSYRTYITADLQDADTSSGRRHRRGVRRRAGRPRREGRVAGTGTAQGGDGDVQQVVLVGLAQPDRLVVIGRASFAGNVAVVALATLQLTGSTVGRVQGICNTLSGDNIITCHHPGLGALSPDQPPQARHAPHWARRIYGAAALVSFRVTGPSGSGRRYTFFGPAM